MMSGFWISRFFTFFHRWNVFGHASVCVQNKINLLKYQYGQWEIRRFGPRPPSDSSLVLNYWYYWSWTFSESATTFSETLPVIFPWRLPCHLCVDPQVVDCLSAPRSLLLAHDADHMSHSCTTWGICKFMIWFESSHFLIVWCHQLLLL